MTNDLWFHVETKYIMTGREELLEMGKGVWNSDSKKQDWWFKIADMQRVCAILGQTPEFDEKEVMAAVNKCPLVKQAIDMPEWKGKGTIEVKKMPDCYLCRTPRKVVDKEGNIEIKWLEYEIPNENVEACMNAIQKVKSRWQWKDKRIPSRKIAEQVCKDLGLRRFFRESGSFDYEKLFGCRQDLFSYVYYPLKILDNLGYISYGKGSRYVTVLQTTFIP